MNAKYTLFRRGGIYYSQDSATRQQKSLRTRDEAGAMKLINARNEAHRQPVLNLHLARDYLRRLDKGCQSQQRIDPANFPPHNRANGWPKSKTWFSKSTTSDSARGLRQS